MDKETAKRLLQEGLLLYVAVRRVAQMEDLRALGAIPLQMDISVDADIVAAVNTITQGHGGIDVLVNNAGFGLYGAMEDSTLADARDPFKVNLFGMVRHYLSRTDISSGEISWLLGFQESNAFIRAFRSWTGTTPAAYRQGHLPLISGVR